MVTNFHKSEAEMVKKYLIWPIRLFLYLIAISIICFYSFCLILTTDFGSKQTSKLLFGDNVSFEDISIEPSLLGMKLDIKGFSFLGAATFSGDRINLEINFLNSLIGKVIYIPSLELYNTEVKLNEGSISEESTQPDIYINELSIINLKAGNIEFNKLELNNFLSKAEEIGFAFNDLSIDLPGSINSLDQFNGRGYFSEDKLFLNIDSNEALIDFTFYDAPSRFKNLEGIIEIDLNNDFSIPFAKLSAGDADRIIKSSFKYNDSFLLELWVEGNQSDVINLIPSTADNVKFFLKDSNFKSNNIDLLLSFTEIDNESNFNIVMKAQEGLLTLSELDLATKSMNLYIDNSSLRIFGDELELPNIELGKFYLSRKLIDNTNYKLIFNDFNNFAIEFGDEGILKSIDGKIPTLDSNFKISFNENRILLNADEVYFDFNILDNYEVINGGLKVYPSGFNSNYFSLDSEQRSSFEFNFNDMELSNLNANFGLLNSSQNPNRNSNLEFTEFNFSLKNSYINFKDNNMGFGGLVKIKGKDISYTDSTFTIDALRVLSLIDIRSRLVNILNADFDKLDQDNFFINSLSGEFFADSAGYANINNLNLNFDVGEAEIMGTISSELESFDTFDLEMSFNSSLSQNIPWYVAILGGFPAAAGAVVVTEVLEDGINQITETKYGISGSADNLIVETRQ
jgi:hypothetical protein